MRYFKQATVLVLIIALLMVAGAELNDGATEPATTEPSPAATRQWTSLVPEPDSKSDKASTVRYYNIPLSQELQEYTFRLCEEYGLDYEMVLALMDQESDYREKVISKTNDYGIMQINKVNHEWLKEELGIEDFLEAEQNILAGIRMLAGLTAKYEDPHLVLMAYNCGESGAKRLWKQGKTTSEYSRSIMARAEELRKEAEQCQQYAVNANAH